MEGQPESSSMETEDVPVVKTKIQGFMRFAEQLCKFYENAEHILEPQTEILNPDELFKVIEEMTVSLETRVDALVVEFNAKKKEENMSGMVEYINSSMFITKQEEVWLLKEMLQDAFARDPSKSLINNYGSEQLKLLSSLVRNATIADLTLNLQEDELMFEYQDSFQNELGQKFQLLARIFLIYSKVTEDPKDETPDDQIYDYKEALESLQTEPKNEDLRDEVQQLLSEIQPQFEELTSVEEQKEWILKGVREMVRLDFVNNLKFVLGKVQNFSDKQNKSFSEFLVRKYGILERIEDCYKRLHRLSD